ncbi:Uncharacterised protein [Chlamydia trachomatis]|nr:Uncharacterised protein [Chlamydia trachomatis]CRH47759.1 Uncharacterised protein [Chlamydia trachomatis]CRH54645.1 Uncharacterised protein [Chlamydia trachomatis]
MFAKEADNNLRIKEKIIINNETVIKYPEFSEARPIASFKIEPIFKLFV